MEFLADLWLPIVLNAIVLFFASFAAWMLLPHHFGDWKKLPNEQRLMDVIRELDIPEGNYMFPNCHTKQQQNSPEHMERYTAGPRGVISVWNIPNMPANLAKTVLFFLVTSAVIGYLTWIACPPGSAFGRVFQFAGITGALVHASSGMLNAVWFKRRMLSDFVDGMVYGLIIGLIFAMFWPGP